MIGGVISQKFTKLWKNPINFFPALHAVENNLVIGHNPAADPILADSDPVVVFKFCHFVDIKIWKIFSDMGI